jgi:SAM-dependent methyltransferase
MTDFSAREVFNRRLPLYAYLEPLLAGRRVLELGAGSGAGADYIASHGAASVLGVYAEPGQVESAQARFDRANLGFRLATNLLDVAPGGPFDVVLVPEAETLLRRPEAVPALSRLLAPGGRLIVVASSADRPAPPAGALAGLGYYELTDALQPHFPAVQMFGVTPFAGFGVVEFDVEGDGLRVDSRLVEGGTETPAAYVAIASVDAAPGLGYALVQVPWAPIETRLTATADVEDRGAVARLAATERRLDDTERRARGRVDEADARVTELRRKLEDSSIQSESAMRIARAQGEEMEELRARLRRAAEDRAALDGEMAKLRRALAEADESVMSLTRRTADEMSAVAQRLAEGLRAPAPVARADAGAHGEELARLRASLAETDARAGAAEQRLEEIGTIGRERQAALDDVVERLGAAEDATARERREVAKLQAQLAELGGASRAQDARETALASRDERIARLEGDKQDLTWRLAELEEKLRQSIGRAVVADSGRVSADELTSARVSRDRALEEFHKAASVHVDEATHWRSSESEQAAFVAELEESLRAAEAAAALATAEAAALRKNSKVLEEADRARRTRLAELEGKLLRLEHERKNQAASAAAASAAASSTSAAASAGGVDPAALAALESHVANVARERDQLRGSVERLTGIAAAGEEGLWKTKADLSTSQARVSALEAEVARIASDLQARAASAAAAGAVHSNGHGADAAVVARELTAMEAGLREELESLTQIEQALEDEIARPAPAPEEQGAEVILLHTTLANYRRRASRLRDELEGIRRRIESLSSSEILGYLEELGEDLAELEK